MDDDFMEKDTRKSAKLKSSYKPNFLAAKVYSKG